MKKTKAYIHTTKAEDRMEIITVVVVVVAEQAVGQGEWRMTQWSTGNSPQNQLATRPTRHIFNQLAAQLEATRLDT